MNKSHLLTVIFTCLLFSACASSGGASGDSMSSEEQRVLAVEDEYVAAEVDRDEGTLRRIVDDRFVFNSNDGSTSGKTELIDAVLGMNMTGQTISERTVIVNGDTAIIFGTTELRFASDAGEDSKSLLRYTSTYINRQGNWHFLALHMAKRND